VCVVHAVVITVRVCVRVLLHDSLTSVLFFFRSFPLLSYERTARPILHKVLRGYNGCVFAFGQTGSGKTYTMQGGGVTGGGDGGDHTRAGGDGGAGGGDNRRDEGGAGEGGGVITMLCHELFTSIEKMVASGKTVDVLAS
jgi:hypothetical protein